jgi:molecular chaperone DnaK
MQRLREAAETAKVELSSTTQTDIMLPFLVTDDDGPKHLEMSLSRKEFEEVIEDLVDTTLKGCQQALDDAGIKTDEVQTLLIVGGTTKIPYVQERLSDFFGQAPRKGVNPDEAIAMGAAIQAGIIGGGVEDVLLIDILPLSLGIAEGPKFAPILFRNSQIPTYRCDSFETRRDHQNSVLIKVYQGEHMEVTKNKLIGLFRMDGLPPAPAGMIKFDVTFRVDENGLLQVEVLEKGTGRSRELICPNTMRLSEAEIQKYKKQLDFDE